MPRALKRSSLWFSSSAVKIKVREQARVFATVKRLAYDPLTQVALLETFDPNNPYKTKEYVLTNVEEIEAKHYLDGLLISLSSTRVGKRGKSVYISIDTDYDERYIYAVAEKRPDGKIVLKLYYGPLCRDHPEDCRD